MGSTRRTAVAIAALGASACLAAPALGGGLAISPAILEHVATTGAVGSITITNSAAAPLAIVVKPRPWRQSRGGRVTPDRRRTLAAQVRISGSTFTLAAGAQRAVGLSLPRMPSGDSLYGGVEVVGTPTSARPPGGVVAVYRLVASMRLDPPASRRRLRLEVGHATVAGHRRGVIVAAHNAGNTLDPVTGSARISGPRGTLNETIRPIRIVPGATVDLPLARARSLPRGSYRVAVSLRQSGRVVTQASRRLTVR